MSPVTAAEVRFLTRVNPALAHERIVTYNQTWAKAMMDDLGRLKSLARDDAHCTYLRGVKREHEQATEAAWDAYERCLAEAPPADIRRAAEAHNRLPMFHSFHAVSRGAAAAHPRPSARPSGRRYDARPRIRRAAARRAAGARSSQDPGGEDDNPDGPGTFASFHRATPGVTGAQRLRVFEALPTELRALYWKRLARQVEGGAR